MERLHATDPHFVRTIKPNGARRPKVYEAPMCLAQLRYAGVFEAVTIRKSGYPFRMSHERFQHWYRCLLLPRSSASAYDLPPTSSGFVVAPWTSPSARERVRQILEHVRQPGLANVQVGHSLVLYRAEEQRLLELLRALALARIVPHLQTYVRAHLARECRRRCLRSAARLRQVLEVACSVGECDAAAREHGRTLGAHARIFAPKVAEMRQLRQLRTAFGEWSLLERELEASLARFVVTTSDDEEQDAFVAVEGAYLQAYDLPPSPTASLCACI